MYLGPKNTNWTRLPLEGHDLVAAYAIRSNRVWLLLTLQYELAQMGCWNVVLKTTLHDLAYCSLFYFTRDFKKLKINSKVCVRGGEDIPTHVMRHSGRKQEWLVLKTLTLFKQWELSKKKRKKRKKNRIEFSVWSWKHSIKGWVTFSQNILWWLQDGTT